MNKGQQVKLPSKIYAEAIVRSVSGESLLHSSSLVTSENVAQFYAEPKLLSSAVERLQTAGFEILDVGKTSISIAADSDIYERSLQTTLETVELPVIKEIVGETTATFINAIDDKPFGEIDTSQTSWDHVLDGIAINEPAYYFRPQIPEESPPQTTRKYLRVPEDIAQGLNATLAHQNDITGRGVKIVMVDTGWYRHPFFSKYNYKVNVILAPGSSAPLADDNGHGTGESANVLAVAPDAELTMVKADVLTLPGEFKNVNSVAAFKKAVSLRPDIISCSWGSNQISRQFSPFNQALAVAIADAVRRGIIVVFAAGNGQWSFPSQHPDVIAAGGVYLHLDGLLKGQLEASNYASSFISQIYPGRRVPDVCGLVGQRPYGAYIMLPVPFGSQKDQEHSFVGDGTKPTDGWAAFSGTSAAAPQLAGVCALIKQLDPGLSPAKVKKILQQTARDVVKGSGHSMTGGNQARAGPDLATGYGLADAYQAVQVIKNLTFSKRQNLSNLFQAPKLISTQGSKKEMYPRLKAKLDEIQIRLDEVLTTEFKDLIEDVELRITEANFVPRSSQSRAILALMKLLIDLPKDFAPELIEKKHVLAAESLIRMQKCQELATQVLIAAIGSKKREVPELAAKALGEFSVSELKKSYNYDETDDRQPTLLLDVVCGENGRCIQDTNGKYRFVPTNGNGSMSPTPESYQDCIQRLGNVKHC
jgi:serine protease AprX